MKRILLMAAFMCCIFSVSAQEGDWSVGASFGYASKLMKINYDDVNYRVNQESNQIALFLNRDLNGTFGLTGEFDLYIPYRMKSDMPSGDVSGTAETNLFLAPYLLAGEDFSIGLAAGPVFSYSKIGIDGIGQKGLFYLDLGLKAWLGYNFNEDWGIFISGRFEWDIFCNGYYDYIPRGGGFSYGGFNASIGVKYSF